MKERVIELIKKSVSETYIAFSPCDEIVGNSMVMVYRISLSNADF